MTEDEIRAHQEICADCGGALQKIKVLQITEGGHLPLTYVSDDAKKKAEHYLPEGVLAAFRCSSCARGVFYGVPNGLDSVV